MIYKNDDGDGVAFWESVIASQAILPNEGGRADDRHADDEYLLYLAEEIGYVACTPGSRMKAYPEGEPYARYDRSEYEYELENDTIIIKVRDSSENSDSVSHPAHYAYGWSNGAEVIDLTEHLSFCAGNVVKYVCRAGRKDPDKHVEDLEKARWYLDREIKRVQEL